MALSLYDAFVPTKQQLLGSLNGLIDKAEEFAKEKGINGAELIEAKLAEDMWNLPWHVRSCWLHGAHTLELIPTGEFSPDFTDLPQDWDAMRAMIADAQSKLSKVAPDDMEAMADKTVGFILGGKRLMDFKGQDFLLSFNQPNFHFHATTFYDILRMKGVPIGKLDYLGVMRVAG